MYYPYSPVEVSFKPSPHRLACRFQSWQVATMLMLFPRQHDMNPHSEFHRHVVQNLNSTHHHFLPPTRTSSSSHHFQASLISFSSTKHQLLIIIRFLNNFNVSRHSISYPFIFSYGMSRSLLHWQLCHWWLCRCSP